MSRAREVVRSEQSRANEFIRLYNEIDKVLRQLTGRDSTESFSAVVKQAAQTNTAVSNYRESLITYGELRNAIVHHRTYPDVIIAEPHPDTVEDLRTIVAMITSPPKLIPTFAAKLRVFALDDPLVDALAYMRLHDYSQVIVKGGNGLDLLTTEGIARWFERQSDEDIISVRDTRLGDALAEQPDGSFVLMPRDASVFDAQHLFTQMPAAGAPRLSAIIITQSGKRTEKPLGIITPWDLISPTHGRAKT